jgi:hypothetical protein
MDNYTEYQWTWTSKNDSDSIEWLQLGKYFLGLNYHKSIAIFDLIFCMEIFVSLLTWLFSYLEVSFPPKPKRVLLKIITYIFLLQLSDVITGACNIGRYAVIDCRYPYEYNGGHIIVSSIFQKFLNFNFLI